MFSLAILGLGMELVLIDRVGERVGECDGIRVSEMVLVGVIVILAVVLVIEAGNLFVGKIV